MQIEETYEGYEDVVARTTFSRDAYTGEVRDKALKAANQMQPSRIIRSDNPENKLPIGVSNEDFGKYLRRRAQGEHIDNYKERVAITRYPMHMQSIVSGFVGSLSEVEKDWVRDWGLLGDPEDISTDMHALWRDCDGEGTNWNIKMNQAAVDLIVIHDVWYAMLPPTGDGLMPRFVIFDLPSITNFRKEDGRLVEVIRHEVVRPRKSLLEPPGDPEKHFIHYTLEGWARYVVEEDSSRKVDSGRWSMPFVGRHGKSRLPIGRVSLPLKYPVGYRVAQSNVDLYNLFSDARNLIRVANHPTLRGMDMSEKQFDKTVELRMKGSNVMWGNWEYIAPAPANAKTGYDIYKEEVRDFYITSMQQYQDSPKAVTARQVEEDSKSRTAFQSLLSEALDEIENDVLFLGSQINNPRSNSRRWGGATVKRSKKFRPVDEFMVLTGLVDRTFMGGRIPADIDTQLDVAVKYYEEQGVSISPERRDALRQRLQDSIDSEDRENSLAASFGVAA